MKHTDTVDTCNCKVVRDRTTCIQQLKKKSCRITLLRSFIQPPQDFLLKRTAGLSAIARAGVGRVLADPDARAYALAVLDELNASTPVAFNHKEKGAATAAMSLLAPSALQVLCAGRIFGWGVGGRLGTFSEPRAVVSKGLD